MTHERYRFCPTWAVQGRQRGKERLKINHCCGATYIKLYSSFKMCFVHSIYVVHLDFDSEVQFEECNTLLSAQTSGSC